MKRKVSDEFAVHDDHSEKVRRLLQHRPGVIEQHAQSQFSQEADIDLRKVVDNFVALYECLDVKDDINVKPNYSYTELIYIAVLRSPNFCLPITEIYRYIKHRFSFFRHSTREHWKNAVRHSLSKTKCFTKIGVGRGQPQSGPLGRATFLWTIVPSSLPTFAKGDYRSNVDRESGTNTLRWGYYRVNAGQFWDRVSAALLHRMETFKHNLYMSAEPRKVFERQICDLSPHDGTVSSVSPTTTDQQLTDRLSPTVRTVHPFVEPVSPVESPTLSPCSSSNSILSSPNISVDSGYETVNSSPEFDIIRPITDYKLDSSYTCDLPSSSPPRAIQQYNLSEPVVPVIQQTSAKYEQCSYPTATYSYPSAPACQINPTYNFNDHQQYGYGYQHPYQFGSYYVNSPVTESTVSVPHNELYADSAKSNVIDYQSTCYYKHVKYS